MRIFAAHDNAPRKQRIRQPPYCAQHNVVAHELIADVVYHHKHYRQQLQESRIGIQGYIRS